MFIEIQCLFFFIVAGKSSENGDTQHKQNGDAKAEVNGDIIMTQNGDITDVKKGEVENKLNVDIQGNVDGPTDNMNLTQNVEKHDPKIQNVEKVLTNGIINDKPLENGKLLKNGHHSGNRDLIVSKGTSDIEIQEKSDEPNTNNKVSFNLSNEFETGEKHANDKLIKDLISSSDVSWKPTTDSRENSNTNSSELKLDHNEKPSLDNPNTIIQEAIDIGKNQMNKLDAYPNKKIDIEDSIKPNLISEVSSEPSKINELDTSTPDTKDFQDNAKVGLSSEITPEINNSTAKDTHKIEIINAAEANEQQKSDSKDVTISPDELQTMQIPAFNDTTPRIVYSDLKSNVDPNSLRKNNLNISEPPLVDFKKDFVSNENDSLPKIEVRDHKTIYDSAEPELPRVKGGSVDQVATVDEVKGIELTDSLPLTSGSEVLSSTEPSASEESGSTYANESTIINTSKISDDLFNTSGNENNKQPENNEQIVSENDVDIAFNSTPDETISDDKRTPLKRIHSKDMPSYERVSTSGDPNVVIASRENSTTNLAETDGGFFNSTELVDELNKDVKGLDVTFEEAEETEEEEEEEEGENTTNKEGKRKKRSFRKSFRKSVGKSIRKRSQENKCILS